jgi:hypothetical protein
MYVTRLMLVGEQRLGNAILTLHFDHYITPAPDKTIILTCLPVDRVQTALDKYLPDRHDIEIIADTVLESQYPDIVAWQDPKNERGTWLKQQALKLSAIDCFDSDVFLIHDPDTFCIKPYQYITNGTVNLFAIPNKSQYMGYYEVIKNALAIERRTTACFVSEIMPVFKTDWLGCKTRIEDTTQQPWLLGLLDNVPYELFGATKQVKWFSEYELLGNWSMYSRAINFTEQKRFQFNHAVDELHGVNDNYNCVCDHGHNGHIRGPASLFAFDGNFNITNLQPALEILHRKLL